MKEIINKHLEGERSLFRCQDAFIKDCIFANGESPLKEGRNLLVDGCTFDYKYPLWYGKGHEVKNCTFHLRSRSGIWYTDDSYFHDLDIQAPKEFRRCNNIRLENIVFSLAEETLWNCTKIKRKNIQVKGDYFVPNP